MCRRKVSRKSHHGCLQCKRRSVKCDEKRPKCTKCEKRLEPCQYGSSGPWIWTNPAAAEHSSTAYPEVAYHLSLSAADTASQAELPTAPTTGDSENLRSRLIRHWKTATALSISRNDSDLRIWQTVVPNEAMSNPYLLHGIFAVSAIHLALINPQDSERQQWIRTAEQHQSEAISLFTGLVEDKDQSQNIGNFVVSSLLIGFAFAFPLALSGPAHEISDPLGEIIQVIMLVKSTMQFSAPILTEVKSAEMSQLTHVEEASSGLSDASRSAISTLYGLNTTRVLDQENRQSFHSAICLLEDVFAHIDGGAEPVSKTFMWISEIPSEFSHLLSDRHPFALVILTHYCVVLHRLRWLWWISSWGQRVLLAIDRTLDSQWKPLIKWAFDETGIEGFVQ